VVSLPPAAEIALALGEYGVPVELVACEALGELAAALEARAGRAAVSGRTLILSAGERAALLAALRRRHRFPHEPATAATAVVALERAEPVRGGYRVLLPDEGCALLDEPRRRRGRSGSARRAHDPARASARGVQKLSSPRGIIPICRPNRALTPHTDDPEKPTG